MSSTSSIAGRPKVQDLSGVSILVLDDDPSMRSLIRGALTRCGCENVLLSGVARDALRLFSTHTIDLVICDWLMEPMSGLDFLRELRRPEYHLSVPVIMLTANSEPRDMALAQRLNISAWLVKPIALPKLIEKISAVLSLSATQVPLDMGLSVEAAAHYRSKLVNDLRDLDDALAAMQRIDPDPGSGWVVAAERCSSWALVSRILHNVKGQAGSFGYDLITSLAALGDELTRGLAGDKDLVYHHHDEVHRCSVALVHAMRLVLQNEIRGPGGEVGARLLAKLQSYVGPVCTKVAMARDRK